MRAEAHMLTDAEKRLREWLTQHPEGGEMWAIVKGGFRRSYALGMVDALRDAADILDRRASGGTAYNAAASEVRAMADRIGGAL